MSPIVKVRIIAVVIAILLTIATAYAVPWVMYVYTHWVDGLTKTQQHWFNIAQAVLGALIASYAFWCWKKKKSQTKK